MAKKLSSSELRPFLQLRKGPINQLRRAPRGGGRTHRASAIQHGQLLLSQIGQLNEEVAAVESARPENYPPLADEVQIIIEGDVDAGALKRLDVRVIDEREGNQFVGISPDASLEKLTERINSYMTEETKKGNPRYEGQIGPINTIRPARYEDKIGLSLKQWREEGRLNPRQSERYDIEIAGGRTEEGERNRSEFDIYLQEFSKLFPSTNDGSPIHHWREYTVVTDSYSIHRVLLPGAVVEDLLNNPKIHWLLLIDRIPRIEDDTIRLRDVTADSLPPVPVISSDAPRIVIVDSGIATGHPLFSDDNNSIIGRQICFIPTWWDNSQDTADHVERGHGTAVASVAAYGSVRDFILNNDPLAYPQFWIENAKILYSAARFHEASPDNDRAKLHDLQVPYWLMHQVVTAFHNPEPNQCRIFNLSVGAEPHRVDKLQSSWSEAIDNLSAENDVLFVVATGNVQLHEVDQLSREIGTYPIYLLDGRARLRDPAQAMNALTVGAFSEYDVVPVTARQNHQPVARANHPAPFTRTNLQDSPIVKPDVIEAGGNLSYDALTQSYNDRIRELAIPIANRNFLTGSSGGIIGYHCGTSMAAPKVAHLAGLIQSTHPEFSTNLIRALIVNSAEWPQPEIFNEVPNPLGTEDGTEIKRRMLRLCGYGIPQADKALTANSYCIVLFSEGVFEWDPMNENDLTSEERYASKVSFYRALFDSADLTHGDILDEKVRVSITLAYNPRVRKTNSAYQAVKMNWHLKRPDETLDNFEGRLLKPRDEQSDSFRTPGERWEWMLKPILNPGQMDRRGTVIKDWFDTELYKIPPEFEIAVTATVNEWYKPPKPLSQRFALVVSIESVRRHVKIFDRIRVRTPVRVQP
ncbi:MAG: S8 family peptidase [Chloroflexi bacterium]|nr:S8 family peptidase [Chloroflexota bacterium]MCI0645593.1 S8 family peptidase [Chloroflexota bacterium]